MNDKPDSGGRERIDQERPPIPAIPADQPIIPNYMAGEGPRMVTLRRMPIMEAEMAKAKLEAEGIACFVADSGMSVVHPLVLPDVRLQVAQTDVPFAEEILSRPAPEGAEGEYADEDWRCPKCHRRTVDLMPLSPRLTRVRNLFFLLIVAQIVIRLILWALPSGDLSPAIDALMGWLLLPWLLAIFFLGLWWLLSKRDKQCRECGHHWSGAAE